MADIAWHTSMADIFDGDREAAIQALLLEKE
jgi:hypothetical protein